MSALIQLDGQAVAQARIRIPRVGVWHAQVMLADTDAWSGAKRATLTFGQLALSGTVSRSGAAYGAGFLYLLGGAGGLASVAPTKGYRQVPLRVPLNDLLQAAGESLSANADPSILNTQLPFWATRRDLVALCIADLLAPTGAVWRIMPDGTFWVGQETWPDAPAFDHLVISGFPTQDLLEIYTENPILMPGQTFQGRHVSYVETTAHDSEIQTTAWLEAA